MIRVKARLEAAWRFVMPCMAAGIVAGCSVTGTSIDETLKTGAISLADDSPSIAATPFDPPVERDAASTDRLIDEDTIRLAVTAADIDRLENGQLPWASAATGSSGVIGNISEFQEAGQICRVFRATRQAYDGLSAYRGEICLDPRSGWWTRTMERDEV